MAIDTTDQALTQRLGTDTRFPLSGNFDSIQGLDTLLQDIQMLLLTIPGERVSRPEYGCNLSSQIWENIDKVAIDGKGMIKAALDQFEPRIKVTSVTSTINRNTDLIIFNIKFSIISTDIISNLIFPFRNSQQLSSQ